MTSLNSSGKCVACGSTKVHYSFSLDEFRVERCESCKLMRLNPQPTDEQLGAIYGSRYFIMSDDPLSQKHASALKSATADHYLDLIQSYLGRSPSGHLLEVGCGHGDLLVKAVERGLKVTGVEYSPHSAAVAQERIQTGGNILTGEIDVLDGESGRYDIVLFADVLEHVRSPRAFLKKVHRLLTEDGIAVAILPSTDSLSARLMGTNWMEFKVEHLWYFSTSNLARLLRTESFGALRSFPGKKSLSLEYVAGHFAHYPVQPFSSLLGFLARIVPKALRRRPFRITASGIVMIGQKASNRRPKVLSIVMPAFNEAATAKASIDRVLSKRIDGIDTELIIVESNSTDGTREIVRDYEGTPGTKVILQPSPMGKGNAVRAGLEVATGDYVLIQDADDEYDIDDYDSLLEPLLAGEADFVLGARHGGGAWKMRKFEGQPLVSGILNFGHWGFATLINVLYGTRMKDPFTMYKVFRRDCIRDLTFECDRFDFDPELVTKLIRRGYIPIEIPVNYRSRSFREGKKVDAWRDPLTWLKAILKYRFSKV